MPDTTPLAPMTPHAAISAFNYLRAVQADDIERFQSGHRWGDSGEGTTHEAPAPLREVFEVST
ncbi:hypothetical protein AB0F01_31105, partial [Streptomyces sp. NPDC029526]